MFISVQRWHDHEGGEQLMNIVTVLVNYVFQYLSTIAFIWNLYKPCSLEMKFLQNLIVSNNLFSRYSSTARGETVGVVGCVIPPPQFKNDVILWQIFLSIGLYVGRCNWSNRNEKGVGRRGDKNAYGAKFRSSYIKIG